MKVIAPGVIMWTNSSKCLRHSILRATCLLDPSHMPPPSLLKKVHPHWETLIYPSQFCNMYIYIHGTEWLAGHIQLSTAVLFDPEATIIRAVLLADGNFVCILKTKAQEELEFTVQPAEKRQWVSLCYCQKLLAYSTHCSDYLSAFFTCVQIFNHLLALQASRSIGKKSMS